MRVVEFEASCAVRRSFRVAQVAGMFDAPPDERLTQTIRAELPDDGDWRIGLITGPSGSGKSLLAKRAFGKALYRRTAWPTDRAVIDCMADLPARAASRLLTAVGLSSPPAWIKPYRVLSGGERMRADVARAVALATAARGAPDEPPLVVFDEFTSTLDRRAACFAAAALAKAIRGGLVACRFVGVTCHADVAEWLEAGWTVDMPDGKLARGRLRRPTIELELYRARRDAWRLFEPHHYLSGQLARGARCFVALCDGAPAAFCATAAMIGRRGRWRVSRLVVLPEFQGVGIGSRVLATVAELHARDGLRMRIVASHAAIIAHCRRSARWRAVRVARDGSRASGARYCGYRASRGRAMVSFEFVSEAA